MGLEPLIDTAPPDFCPLHDYLNLNPRIMRAILRMENDGKRSIKTTLDAAF